MSKTDERPGEILFLDDLINTPLDSIEESKAESTKELEAALEGKDYDDDFFTNVKIEEEVLPEESETVDLLNSEEAVESTVTQEASDSIDPTVDLQKEYRKKLLKSIFGEEVDSLIVPNEDGEDVEIPLDDFDLDEDTFKDIINNKIQAEKEAALEGRVKVDDLDDLTQSLVELSRKGGDVRELLEYKAAYTDPLDRLDLSTKEGQREAIYLYLRGRQEPEEEIQLRIEAYEAKGLLEEKAKQFDGEIRGSIKNLVEQRKKEAEQLAEQKKEQLKSYKKEFGESLKSKFELNDKVREKLVDMATKPNKENKYEMDLAYQSARSNPEEAAMLALWFTDREEFIRQISSKKVKEEQLKTVQKIRLASKRKNNTDVSLPSKSGGDKGVVLFDDLV